VTTTILRSIVVLAAVVVGAAGCVGSNASTCGKQLVCPGGMMCTPAGDSCVEAEFVLSCQHATDGASCSVAGLPPATCMAGVCQASRCGDGRITGGEECDGALFKEGQDCQTAGFYNKDGLKCGADCKLDTTACTGKCGDGIKNGNEQCDGKDLGGASCFAAGFYKAPGLGCKADCTFDTTTCGGGKCGDGTINGLEQCDGKQFNRTCAAMGFAGAMSGLQCTSACTFAADSCMCSPGVRCASKTQRCECSKFGCGCVAVQ
jgi:hypothetical protein